MYPLLESLQTDEKGTPYYIEETHSTLIANDYEYQLKGRS